MHGTETLKYRFRTNWIFILFIYFFICKPIYWYYWYTTAISLDVGAKLTCNWQSRVVFAMCASAYFWLIRSRREATTQLVFVNTSYLTLTWCVTPLRITQVIWTTFGALLCPFEAKNLPSSFIKIAWGKKCPVFFLRFCAKAERNSFNLCVNHSFKK